MAYQIHIVLPESLKIEELEEAWRKAIGETEGVRFVHDCLNVLLNPKTGGPVKIRGSMLDVEVFFPNEDTWHRALHWKGDRASINARFGIGDDEDPAWVAVKNIAKNLSATLKGDNGEVYELN